MTAMGRKRTFRQDSDVSLLYPRPDHTSRLPETPEERRVGKYVRSIRVEDASGAQFEMHEYRSDSFLMRGRRSHSITAS